MKTFGLLLATSAVVLGVVDFLDRRGVEQRAAETVAESGRSETLTALSAEPDRVRLRVLASRALLQAALEPFPPAISEELIEATLAGRVEQLADARQLAEEAAQARPDDWQAQMLVGATTYLERSLLQQRELFTDSAAWEQPLQRAAELAPSKPEPQRFLTMAYLEIWRMLSERKRELTRQMLRQSFEDPATYQRYIGPWLRVSSDLDEALEVLPLRGFVWRDLRTRFRTAKDWRRYLLALDRIDESQRIELESWRDEARQRLALGDLKRGRTLLIEVLGALPVDGRWAALFDDTLTELPPGPIHRVPAENVRAWLVWALEICTFTDCPLSDESLRRAAGLATDLPASQRAAALAASGDLSGARSLFDRAGDKTTNEWSTYHLLRARRSAAQGNASSARTALALANPLPELRLGIAATRRQLDGAATGLDASWRPVGEHRFTWPLTGPPGVAEEGETLELTLANLPPRGCPIEVLLDGTRVARQLAHPSRPRVRVALEVPLTAAEHQVELRSPAGCYFVPESLSAR